MKNLITKSFIALAAMALATVPCHALSVVCNYVPVGSTIPGIGTSRAINPAICHPTNLGAQRALERFKIIVIEAAIYWESIYSFSSSDVLTIDYGFCDPSNLPALAAAGSGATSFVPSGPGIGNINRCSIGFNVQHNFYLDPDFSTWSEYGSAVTSTNVAYPGHPGQFVEDERFTTSGGAGDASFTDLYDIALHEIGHQLGMTSGSAKYNNETLDGDIDVTAPRPIPGITWLSNDHAGHLTYTGQPHSLMAPHDQTGQRKWPSQADISCIAQIEGWWVGAWTDAPGGGGPQGPAANNPPH